MSLYSSIKENLFPSKQESVNELPQFIPTPATEQPQFSEAHIQLIERNHQVESKEDMINFIDESGLSMGCKIMFKNVITNVYDRNIIFADNSKTNGVDIAYLEIMIDIFPLFITAATKSDRLKPEYNQIKSEIEVQLRSRLSRTTSKDRERIIATKNVTTNEVLLKKDHEEKK